MNMLFGCVILGFLMALFFGSAIIGRRFGCYQLSHNANKLEIVGVAEGAVFALLGLLLAFTFSGAYERFEARKLHIIEEANIFETAYQRISLLDQQKQASLREDFRQYLSLHLAAYSHLPHLKVVREDVKQLKVLEEKIWLQTVQASKDGSQSMAQLFVSSVNAMFESVNTGMKMIWVHPPVVIFLLLIGLAMLGAFLSGYNTAESSSPQSLHIVCYVILTAITIYLVLDLEFPRMGLIQIDSFDRFLVEVRDRM